MNTAFERLLLRPAEAAKALGISPRTLWSLAIPRVQIGKRGVRYDVNDLRAWIEKNKNNKVVATGDVSIMTDVSHRIFKQQN